MARALNDDERRFCKAIGSVLKDFRESAGFIRAEVARAAEVHPSTYYRWETGENDMPIHKLRAVCKKLGTRIDCTWELAEQRAKEMERGLAEAG